MTHSKDRSSDSEGQAGVYGHRKATLLRITPYRRAIELFAELGIEPPSEEWLELIVWNVIQAQTLLFSAALFPPDANSLDNFLECFYLPTID